MYILFLRVTVSYCRKRLTQTGTYLYQYIFFLPLQEDKIEDLMQKVMSGLSRQPAVVENLRWSRRLRLSMRIYNKAWEHL
ncbi:hypothetical protein Bca4012_100776 [Brassica carinata]